MREVGFIVFALLLAGLAILLVIPTIGMDVRLWVLIASAVGGGMFAAIFVLLGESVIEDIVKSVVLLILGAVWWSTSVERGYMFVAVLLSGAIGTLVNQLNQYSAGKHTSE